MIVDANVLISALIGRSYDDLKSWRDRGLELRTPQPQMRETMLVLRDKMGLSAEELARQIARLDGVIEIVEPQDYAGLEQRACERLGPGGQPDWPVLAAAIALDEPILTNDRDFFGVGVTVWSTSVFKREMESPNG